MQYRPILHVSGLMTLGLGAMMLPCVVVDIVSLREAASTMREANELAAQTGQTLNQVLEERASAAPWLFFEPEDFGWKIYLLLSIVWMTIGGALAVGTKPTDEGVRTHEAFLLTVVSWMMIVLVGATPFFIGFGFNLTDSVFEAMSGLTTTGATIMEGIETYPPSLILWRAILQWVGGVGIIVTAIAILPSLKVGGMQLFQLESSDTQGKMLPHIGEIAMQTALVYLGLTLICAGLYRVTGMNEFQAITMSMTTIATGGFADSDASFFPYVDSGADIVAIVFMMLGSLPFSLMVLSVHGDWKAFLRDPQPIVWISTAIVLTLLMMAYVTTRDHIDVGPEGPLRMVMFNVVSVLSGTGYGTEDFSLWGPFASSLFVVAMFFGGCAGSASCGLKTFRVHIAFMSLFSYAKTMIRPNQIAPVRYAGKPVRPETMQSIMLFFFLYFATFAVQACILALSGLEPTTAISAAAATLNNVGPGLGEVGPAGNFAHLTTIGKWTCTVAMLLGRLELIAVFVILTPGFWRN